MSWSPEEADLIDAIAAQLAEESAELVGLEHRRAAVSEWETGPRTARAAFRWLVASCLDRAELCDGERAAAYRRIGRSLELIAGLDIPEEYSARQVLAGFRAQGNDVCDRLAQMLEDEGVVPPLRPDGAAPLWFWIYDAAINQAKAQADRGLAARWYQIFHTYRAGHRLLCRAIVRRTL